MPSIKTISVVIFILFSSFTVIANDSPPRDPYKYFFDESWGDMQEELDNARNGQKKGILVFFEMDECPFCHYMKSFILNQKSVQDYYKQHFLIFSIDIEGDIEMVNFQGKTLRQKDFAVKQNRVRATPVFAFFDLEGKRIHRLIGKTKNAEEFMLLGSYVADGEYMNMPFIKYKKMMRKKKT